jgi:hypothetical protein
MSTTISKNTLSATEDEIHALLEKCLFKEYLQSKGYTQESLNALPEDKAHQIMKEASTYASSKLAEIEIRARFTEDLRETGRSLKV